MSQTPDVTRSIPSTDGHSVNAAPAAATSAVLRPSDPAPAGARKVEGIDFDHYAGRNITVDELVRGLATTGFQASAVADAVRIINDMVPSPLPHPLLFAPPLATFVPPLQLTPRSRRQRTYRSPTTAAGTTIFLGYTSNLISSGLRESLRYLARHRHISAIVTTAGGIEEDLIKCLAPTYLGSFAADGAALRAKGMNRIGNLVVPNANYCRFEDWVVPILDAMLREQEHARDAPDPVRWTPSKVIRRLGREIDDEASVCYWAYKNDIPIFCPALTDGSLGDMLYFHTFKSSPNQLRIDIVEDIRAINTMAVRAERAGMIVLGGGVVKHHIANACLMRNGAESAVYVNTAQEFDGSDAGARPDEAVSWGKIKAGADSVKVCATWRCSCGAILIPSTCRCTPTRPSSFRSS